MTPTQAIVELRADPAKWLARYHLLTFMGDPDTFGPQLHYLGSQAAEAGGNAPRRTVGSEANYLAWKGKGKRAFSIRPNLQDVRLLPDVAQLRVINIPVVHSDTLHGQYQGLATLQLGAAEGHDVMVTTLLNGCSFVVQGAQPPAVRHVRPTGGTTAGALRQQLAPHYPRVFGDGDGYDERTEDATVIGIRNHGTWRIYAQVHTAGVRDIRKVVPIL